MKKILSLCTKIDTLAVSLYTWFSEKSDSENLREFWKTLAEEEKTHVQAWNFLLQLAEQNAIESLFEDESQTEKEISELLALISNEYTNRLTLTTQKEMFTKACTIELYMLDPAFIKLFELFRTLASHSFPDIDYEVHLTHFADKVRITCLVPELEILLDKIFRLWNKNKTLLEKSQTDFLTRLYNRQGFSEIVKPLCHLVSRNSGHSGLFMIDIDFFKLVNDTQGHQAGDLVLAELGAIIKKNIRRSDIAGRYGGEEFIIYLPDINPGTIHELAEKLRKEVEKSSTMPVPITVSIGFTTIYHSDNIEKDIEMMISNADKNLYFAKEHGRNRIAGDQTTGRQGHSDIADGIPK